VGTTSEPFDTRDNRLVPRFIRRYKGVIKATPLGSVLLFSRD
jgi:hypothetical protein